MDPEGRSFAYRRTGVGRARGTPVEVPEDAGTVLAGADEDAVGLADKQAEDLSGVAKEMHLGLHLHLGGLWKRAGL